jgi:hypothetical protein
MVTLYDDVSDTAIVFGQFSGKRAKIDAVVSRSLWYNGRRKVTGGGDMKPQFANVFNVSVNDNRSECSLSFYHMYVQHNYTPQPKGLIDMPEKTVDEVASIMLTRDGAHALTRLLIQSFGMPEDKA